MTEHALHLDDFKFPSDLANKRANFRFVVDVRYKDEEDKFTTENIVMPGLDTFWECDEKKSRKPNYVRDDDQPKFNMRLIDDWDKLVLRFKANKVYMMRVKVFDVDRPDIWDKISDALSNLIAAVISKGKEAVNIPGAGDAIGSIADEINSTISKKLANGDKVLFKGSKVLDEGDTVVIKGKGSTDGSEDDFYEIKFKHVVGN